MAARFQHPGLVLGASGPVRRTQGLNDAAQDFSHTNPTSGSFGAGFLFCEADATAFDCNSPASTFARRAAAPGA